MEGSAEALANQGVRGSSLVAAMKDSGLSIVVTLPDITTSEGVLRLLAKQTEMRHVKVCKEDEGIGIIADNYLHGVLNDDAAVALQFAPADFQWMPLSEPLVDVWPTLLRLKAKDKITPDEYDRLKRSAERLHFADRTPEAMVADAGLGHRLHAILGAYEAHRVSQKQIDAMELVSAMRNAVPKGGARHWEFSQSPMWRQFLRTTHG